MRSQSVGWWRADCVLRGQRVPKVRTEAELGEGRTHVGDRNGELFTGFPDSFLSSAFLFRTDLLSGIWKLVGTTKIWRVMWFAFHSYYWHSKARRKILFCRYLKYKWTTFIVLDYSCGTSFVGQGAGRGVRNRHAVDTHPCIHAHGPLWWKCLLHLQGAEEIEH